MVRFGEDYLLPVSKLWQNEEGTFITVSIAFMGVIRKTTSQLQRRPFTGKN